MKNRLHGLTRWPKDPLDSAVMAETDLAFVEIMAASGVDTPELKTVAEAARQRLETARSRLLKRKEKPK